MKEHMNDDEVRQRLVTERERLEEARQAVVSDGYLGQPDPDRAQELSGAGGHPADPETDVYSETGAYPETGTGSDAGAGSDIDTESGADTFYMERDQSLLERVRSDLDDVDSALRRLEEGSYGHCEACGEPIADERLEAMPAARFCLVHQEVAESGGPAGARLGRL